MTGIDQLRKLGVAKVFREMKFDPVVGSFAERVL